MRRAVVLVALVIGVLACGKSGDPALQIAKRSDVIDVREPTFSMHLQRNGRRFDYRTSAVRHEKADVPRTESGSVDAAIVDRFLNAVADGRVKSNPDAPRPVRVDIWPRVGELALGLSLEGTEPDYVAFITSTGRPKLP